MSLFRSRDTSKHRKKPKWLTVTSQTHSLTYGPSSSTGFRWQREGLCVQCWRQRCWPLSEPADLCRWVSLRWAREGWEPPVVIQRTNWPSSSSCHLGEDQKPGPSSTTRPQHSTPLKRQANKWRRVSGEKEIGGEMAADTDLNKNGLWALPNFEENTVWGTRVANKTVGRSV